MDGPPGMMVPDGMPESGMEMPEPGIMPEPPMGMPPPEEMMEMPPPEDEVIEDDQGS
jgi:hypothetical protein